MREPAGMPPNERAAFRPFWTGEEGSREAQGYKAYYIQLQRFSRFVVYWDLRLFQALRGVSSRRVPGRSVHPFQSLAAAPLAGGGFPTLAVSPAPGGDSDATRADRAVYRRPPGLTGDPLSHT